MVGCIIRPFVIFVAILVLVLWFRVIVICIDLAFAVSSVLITLLNRALFIATYCVASLSIVLLCLSLLLMLFRGCALGGFAPAVSVLVMTKCSRSHSSKRWEMFP